MGFLYPVDYMIDLPECLLDDFLLYIYRHLLLYIDLLVLLSSYLYLLFHLVLYYQYLLCYGVLNIDINNTYIYIV